MKTFINKGNFLQVDSNAMQTKAVKRYVTVGTVMVANKRVQSLAASALTQSTGSAYLSSGERLNKPTRTDIEAAGRKVMATCFHKKTA